jgi:hypothetical protein
MAEFVYKARKKKAPLFRVCSKRVIVWRIGPIAEAGSPAVSVEAAAKVKPNPGDRAAAKAQAASQPPA